LLLFIVCKVKFTRSKYIHSVTAWQRLTLLFYRSKQRIDWPSVKMRFEARAAGKKFSTIFRRFISICAGTC